MFFKLYLPSQHKGGESSSRGKHSDAPPWANLQRGARGLRKVCDGSHVSKFFRVSSEKEARLELTTGEALGWSESEASVGYLSILETMSTLFLS